MRNFLVFLFVCVSFSSFAQIDEVRRITKKLCSEEFFGRGYYQKGDSLAADYLAREFQILGIDGYNGTIKQPFEIKSVNTFPGKMKVSNASTIFEPGVHFIVDPSSSGFVGQLKPFLLTTEMLLDREVLGRVIRDTEFRTDHSYHLDLEL